MKSPADWQAEAQWLRGLLTTRTLFFPERWNLSSFETKLMGILIDHRVASIDTLIEGAYWDQEEPDNAYNSVRVAIFHLRQKLEPFGIWIRTYYGVGYQLEPPGKTIVVRELE